MTAADDDAPVIVVDNREPKPLEFARFRSEPGTLYSGDYSFRGGEHLFAVETKHSLEDLASSLTTGRERFERELHRLRGFRFSRLLLTGSRLLVEQGRYRSRMTPKALLASLDAFEARYSVPVVWVRDRPAAAAEIERWAFWFRRELRKAAAV